MLQHDVTVRFGGEFQGDEARLFDLADAMIGRQADVGHAEGQRSARGAVGVIEILGAGRHAIRAIEDRHQNGLRLWRLRCRAAAGYQHDECDHRQRFVHEFPRRGFAKPTLQSEIVARSGRSR